MPDHSSFKEILQRFYKNFEGPVTDSHWDRIAKELQRKKRKRRFLILFLFVFMGIASTAGYLSLRLSNTLTSPLKTTRTDTSDHNDTPDQNFYQDPQDSFASALVTKVDTTNREAPIVGTSTPLQRSKEYLPGELSKTGKPMKSDNAGELNSDTLMPATRRLMDITGIAVIENFNRRKPQELITISFASLPDSSLLLPGATDSALNSNPGSWLMRNLQLGMGLGRASRRNRGDRIHIAQGVSQTREALAKQRDRAVEASLNAFAEVSLTRWLSIGLGLGYQTVYEQTHFEHIHTEVPVYKDSSQTQLQNIIKFDPNSAPRSLIVIGNNYSSVKLPFSLGMQKRITSRLQIAIKGGYAFQRPVYASMRYFDINRLRYVNIARNSFKLGNELSYSLVIGHDIGQFGGVQLELSQHRSTSSFTWLETELSSKNTFTRIQLSTYIRF